MYNFRENERSEAGDREGRKGKRVRGLLCRAALDGCWGVSPSPTECLAGSQARQANRRSSRRAGSPARPLSITLSADMRRARRAAVSPAAARVQPEAVI